MNAQGAWVWVCLFIYLFRRLSHTHAQASPTSGANLAHLAQCVIS